jgi:hypothetical protein
MSTVKLSKLIQLNFETCRVIEKAGQHATASRGRIN